MTERKTSPIVPGQSRERILVGMSGGVDSSVAAALLLREGHDVAGVTMQTYSGELGETGLGGHGCYGPGEQEELDQARDVAAELGIDHHVVDVRAIYRREVVDYYCSEYQAGRTPNPCVRCNRSVKFGALLDQAREAGIVFERFATGHYVRTHYDETAGRQCLRRGADPKKDQSYFLSALRQDQLKQAVFPLGNLSKPEVRALAASFGLTVAEQPESQDFAEGLHAAFFEEGAGSGPIVDGEGREVGRHRGIHLYTVGQRRGLGVSAPTPLYVTAIDATTNRITVGPKSAVMGWGLSASGINWVSIPAPSEPFRAEARIRYQHSAAAAEVLPRADGGLDLRFDEPQLAITPGQIVVLYDGDLLLGGGTIERELAAG